MYSFPHFLQPGKAAGLVLAAIIFLSLMPAASADMHVNKNLQLTNDSNYNHPSWSPDGEKLVFAYDQAIWSMNADGSDRKKLYDNLAWEGDPVYNHNGSRIYYATESKKAYSARYTSIHMMDADGGNVVKLTESADAKDPVVSPDGTKIAYVSRLAGNYDVWIMDTDGYNNERLTDSQGDESSPSWSPDGSKLVYSLEGAILVQETDSVKPTVLLDNSYDNVEPSFSSDGNMIIFSSDQGGDYDIWIMGADGKGFTMLTSVSSNERAPAWSPDGSKIAYVSNEDGEYNIWIMDLKDQNLQLQEEEEEIVDTEQRQMNPYIDRIRLFANENPRDFIISVLIISFLLVSLIVYSFLRKIR